MPVFQRLVLFSVALGACNLPEGVDPTGICNVDANGWANIDLDSVPNATISLSIATLGAAEEAFGLNSYTGMYKATQGSLVDNTETDARYVLSCPQDAGNKTIKLNLTRHRNYTAFQAEWLMLFPKDSWTQVETELELFTWNPYGSVIPLKEYRPLDPTINDLAAALDDARTDELIVWMEIAKEGDYEVKYGNPYLKSDGTKWVAFEFKSTLLRVGTPWAECTDD